MSERNPAGKVVAYWYVDKDLKKQIELEALTQDVSTSAFAEAILERGMKNPPSMKETRGRKKKSETVENS